MNLIASLLVFLPLLNAQPAPRPAAGAIRWDAWHGRKGAPGRAVEKALGPSEWRYRVPFFARVISETEVSIDGSSQEVMDREIAYASSAGLDYWAFLAYDDADPMSLSLKRYLSSTHKNEIQFCLITELSRWGTKSAHREQIARYASMMKEPTYFKTPTGRPLFYLGFLNDACVTQAWGSVEELRKAVDELRELAGNPYIVIMDFSPVKGAKWREQLGADAISAYAASGGGIQAPYAALTKYAEDFWNRCKNTGAEVVPIVMSGWDRRPRIVNPVPWEKYQKPGEGIEKYYQTATPAAIAEHLQHSLDWIRANKAASPANAALIYAWNENDEGGWLTPTLHEGPARLDALRKVLK
jgi:hypothetical protein